MEGVQGSDPKIDLESFYAPGATDPKSKKESDEVIEGESEEDSDDELEETDSEDEEESDDNADTEDDEDDGDVDEEDDFEEEEETEDDLKVKAKKAEKKRRGFQSENAKLKAQLKAQETTNAQLLAQMNQQVTNPNYTQPPPEGDADLSDLKAIIAGDPDDYPTNDKILKVIEGIESRNKAGRSQQQAQQQNASWMQAQGDFQEVNSYASKNNLQADPYFSGANTDETGAFFAVRAKIQEQRILKLESENKALKRRSKKKSKGKIPKTGSGGNMNSQTRPGKKSSKESFWTQFSDGW